MRNTLIRKGVTWAIVVIAVWVATGVMPRTATAQKASVPRAQDKLALGESEVKRLLLLVDANKDGKVSKQDFMRFVEAAFDRLDKDNTGELDLADVTQWKVPAIRFSAVGR